MRGFFALCVLGLSMSCTDQANRDALLDRVERMNLMPLEAPEAYSADLVELGESLFFDPLLSGNRDQACASCHSLETATADSRSLSVGTAAIDVNGIRLPGPDHSFTPRNAAALWDLGQDSVGTMFWDARIARVEEGAVFYDVGHEASKVARLIFPDEDRLSAIQPLFPVLDRDEMRGEQEDPVTDGHNELATVFDDDFDGVWRALMGRILAYPDYQLAFETAFPDVPVDELEFAHAARAIGAYMDTRFVSTDTPWDRFLDGDVGVLSSAQVRGANLFYGEAGCHTCHSGPLFSDEKLYNYAVRPMTRGPSQLEFVDLGAQHRTHSGSEGRFGFRTPRLRNVALTGPWMHNGSYTSLEAVLAHKADPIDGLWNYDSEQLEESIRLQVHRRAETLEDVANSISEQVPRSLDLDSGDIADLIAFLEALTSPVAESLAESIPDRVHSSLPIPKP